MSLDAVRTVSLLGATMSTGLMAGVFGLYAHTIMPGLRTTDDRTFIGAFQSIDHAIINPWFIGASFLGAAVFTSVAAATNRHTPACRWILAALIAYLATMVITVAVHVPLNDAIKAAGNPDQIADLHRVRSNFREARWAAWNLARAVASTTGFAILMWSLVLHGRATR